MKIAILGAGNVGTTLGRGFTRAGHAITYGVRNPADAKYDRLRKEGAGVEPIAAAVAATDAALLTVPWGAAESALAAAGDFGGKPLLDCTNPIGPGLTLTHGHTDSGAEQVQRWAKSAKVVKVFNSTGVENMANPLYGTTPAAMFVCGDDENASQVALQLAGDLGFDALHCGPLLRARLLEPLALLWIDLALVRGHGRDIALALLRR
ncbi:MAG: NAD(P)-binding domain-containing protein [Myxococcales bacterium]|nr:NAD(P)-binding domain-containing protein [Myxococcales bacterium]